MQMVLPSPAAGPRGVACAAAEACRQVRAGRRESWPPPWAPPVDAVTAQSLHVDVTEITKALLMGHCLLSAQCRGARRVGVGCSSLCMGMGTFVTFRSASSSTERKGQCRVRPTGIGGHVVQPWRGGPGDACCSPPQVRGEL